MSTTKLIHADATKDFFVRMITRDISLRDCIFDLLDNAIDGARRVPATGELKFAGKEIDIAFDSNCFQIKDNCGGLDLSDAIDYAFHFGRKPDSPSDVKGGIGLYGIGMKRAIFKIGWDCEVISHANDASFKVLVNVREWQSKESWDFEYEDIVAQSDKGVTIQIKDLNQGVSLLLGDKGFNNDLIKDIARDYAFFIQQGLQIKVNKELVPSYMYQLVSSENVAPAVLSYIDEGVSVRILVGLVDKLPEDIPEELKPSAVERYGWFVICNDRVVLAADKTERTVWGDDDFKVWHPQYNGFSGFVFFKSDDQSKLPWTTTKRELDSSSPLYRRAVVKMKQLTDDFTRYTTLRKQDIEAAREAENKQLTTIDVSKLTAPQTFKMPTFASVSNAPTMVSINFQRHKKEVDEIREHLGRPGMSNKDVGIIAFEFYREVELGK